MGVLQTRLGLSEGKLEEYTPTQAGGEDMGREEMMMGNVGYLKL